MEKVAIWTGMTQTHGFLVEVYRDAKAGGFVAQIRTSSPALIPQYIPGTPTPMMEFDDPEELRSEELIQRGELTKNRISGRCGRILQFIEI
jgi:hypothetical protein